MFLAQLLARQWDQLEFDRGYGKRDGRDTEDDITKKVKVKLLIYRRLDPKAFSIWLSDMDDYLISMKCQNMSGSICQDEVSWTSQNLLEQHWEANWASRASPNHVLGWNEREAKEKYLLITYKDHLMDELILLRQSSLSILEYISKFDGLIVQRQWRV